MKRSSGILLPISSLPSPYGIGCLDCEAFRFVDFLSDAMQSYWQILPLHPTGYGNSPYQADSSFAGDPLYIDLGSLVEHGWLTREDCADAGGAHSPERVDYTALRKRRYPLLQKAFENAQKSPEWGEDTLSAVLAASPWLEDYALFSALKEAHGGLPWYAWEEDLRRRKPEALDKAKRELSEQIQFRIFLQSCFFEQWQRLKNYANQKGIRIIGDIPIYVSHDSADVWMHPELFLLDASLNPTAVAGCPPDGFSPDGQRWGNPLYHWKVHADTGYAWWIRRLDHAFHLFDVVRIDHFRGFDEYYAIPATSPTAREGHWEKGPGMEFFRAVKAFLGEKDVIVEDLGFVTNSVRQLVIDSGFPNMKVIQFGFDARDTSGGGEHLPHNYPENCVAYTGTHDNQTLAAWLSEITDEEREEVQGYLGDRFTPKHLLSRSLIALLFRSAASLCIIPIQDWLGLGKEARINTPGAVEGNWEWRMGAGSASPSLAKEISYMTRRFGRASGEERK